MSLLAVTGCCVAAIVLLAVLPGESGLGDVAERSPSGRELGRSEKTQGAFRRPWQGTPFDRQAASP